MHFLKKSFLNENGQAILILLVVMVVGLAVGLSVIQRSLGDVSTSSKVEQSSRAFSVAEAGIEKALSGDTAVFNSGVNFADSNASATVKDSGLQPPLVPTGQRQGPLEYPPMSKEEIAQVWLSDYNAQASTPAIYYTQSSLDVYWGNSRTDKAAIEITILYYNGTNFQEVKKYYDQTTAVRSIPNGFQQVDCSGSGFTFGPNAYFCKQTITGLPASPSILVLLRARLLYTTTSQPFAVQTVGTCGKDCSIPPQARVFLSTGVAGGTQRKIKVFQLDKVVPPYFDYAIFSASSISK